MATATPYLSPYWLKVADKASVIGWAISLASFPVHLYNDVQASTGSVQLTSSPSGNFILSSATISSLATCASFPWQVMINIWVADMIDPYMNGRLLPMKSEVLLRAFSAAMCVGVALLEAGTDLRSGLIGGSGSRGAAASTTAQVCWNVGALMFLLQGLAWALYAIILLPLVYGKVRVARDPTKEIRYQFVL